MAGKQVTVVVRMKAKTGMEVRVRQELLNLLKPTRAERGCINFDMHQAPNDPSLFLFHENWVSEEDLKRHFETQHIKRWIEEAKALLAEPMELMRWRKVD
ncbi:MAG: putative quinol monooxygenase [Nitrospiraceae bacterium]